MPTTRSEAAGCGATASGGRTAGGRLTPDSDALGEAATARRIGGAASSRALRAPGATVRIAARGAGTIAEGRVAGGRICDGAVDAAADCAIDRGEILGLDGALLSVAAARAARLERAAAERPGARARRTGDPRLESQEVTRVKKIAARQGRVIVFIDESGLSERPCRARTWAPKGETPVPQYRFSWNTQVGRTSHCLRKNAYWLSLTAREGC